jgi:hypothetical protein
MTRARAGTRRSVLRRGSSSLLVGPLLSLRDEQREGLGIPSALAALSSDARFQADSAKLQEELRPGGTDANARRP